MGRLFGPGRYFGLEIAGWQNVPASPVMVVSNHSGGTTIPDVWGFLVGWYRQFGVDRPVHPMAHEMIFSNRFTGKYFAERGVLRGSPALGARVLSEHRRDLMVMPGGEQDTWRPYSQRYQVNFAGRTGYARLALRCGVSIVPIANAGAHETLRVLTDGRSIARAMGLRELARAEIFPIHLSLPYGLAIGPWPHIPMPVTLRYKIGAPIAPPVRLEPGEEPSTEHVLAFDAQVRDAVQGLLDELREEDPRAPRGAARAPVREPVASAAAPVAEPAAAQAAETPTPERVSTLPSPPVMAAPRAARRTEPPPPPSGADARLHAAG